MTTMSSESVCQVSRSWVDVGSFYTLLFLFLRFLQRQFGIFWIYHRIVSCHSLEVFIFIYLFIVMFLLHVKMTENP
jgi:hypothetical protein